MKISREQSKLLTELLPQIKNELGIGIGYSHPVIGHHVHEDDQFIIFEAPDIDESNINIFSRDDIEFQYNGPIVYSRIAQFPEHDEEVEDLLKQVDEAIMSGQIWFDPGCVRKIDGYQFDISLREDLYKVKVTTPRGDGLVFVVTYKELKKSIKDHEFLKNVIKIIDEFWPKPSWKQRILIFTKSVMSWFKNLFKRG